MSEDTEGFKPWAKSIRNYCNARRAGLSATLDWTETHPSPTIRQDVEQLSRNEEVDANADLYDTWSPSPRMSPLCLIPLQRQAVLWYFCNNCNATRPKTIDNQFSIDATLHFGVLLQHGKHIDLLAFPCIMGIIFAWWRSHAAWEANMYNLKQYCLRACVLIFNWLKLTCCYYHAAWE